MAALKGCATSDTSDLFQLLELFGVTAGDPVTYATVIAALALSALAASYAAARRAARVDPMTALRTD